MKKVIVHKSAVPIYIAAGAWAAYALLFPLYRVGHFAIAAAVSAAAYFVSRCFCKDVKEEIEVEPEPVRTGNEALDEMIAQGQLALKEMRRRSHQPSDPPAGGAVRQDLRPGEAETGKAAPDPQVHELLPAHHSEAAQHL